MGAMSLWLRTVQLPTICTTNFTRNMYIVQYFMKYRFFNKLYFGLPKYIPPVPLVRQGFVNIGVQSNNMSFINTILL
jgi:hypothetical protein